jgi:hypothetical protein
VQNFFNRVFLIVVLSISAMTLSACGNDPGTRALTGAGIGAGAGAVGGAMVGNPLAGAVIGGAGGAAIGAATTPR